MPRPLRLEYPDAWYHVMNRGAGYQTIFDTPQHREIFISLLSETTELFKIEIHAYCLMDNHYHLLIKTPHGNLSRAMRHINGVYTQRYNRLEKTNGPLFRGRYKSILVDKDSYLLQVSRYIHRNPLDLKSNYQLAKYQWSSYRNYIKFEKAPAWLKTQEILQIIAQRKQSENYRLYVESGMDEKTVAFYKKKNHPVILGGDEFKKRLLKGLESKQKRVALPNYKRTENLPTLDEIIIACSGYFAISKNELIRVRRGVTNEPRKIAMYACRIWSNEKLSKVAEKFKCESHSSVSNIVFEIKQKLEQEPKLRKQLNMIKENLK